MSVPQAANGERGLAGPDANRHARSLSPPPDLCVARTTMLDVAYQDWGPRDGKEVVLLHGFPYDVHAYENVAPLLSQQGCRVIVPYLRGYGPTRFIDSRIPRSGEQAALAKDLLDLIDVLNLRSPVLAGYDWGGRACCIAAALMPERITGLVTGGGYNILADLNVASVLPPQMHHVLWYQYYLHRPRAHEQLAVQRNEFCRYLWSLWSPTWRFDDTTFARSARSFENPDFVDVVVHSYRHRWGLADGDPALAPLAADAAARPAIRVPTIVLQGETAAFANLASDRDMDRFTGDWQFLSLPDVGHNIPQERPEAVADAVLRLLDGSSSR